MAKQKASSESLEPSKESSAVAPPQATEPLNPEAKGPGAAPETLESIADHIANVAPEPNEKAIEHATQESQSENTEGEPEKKSGRGQGQEGKKRGPYKTGQARSQVNQPRKPKGQPEVFDEEKYKRCYMAGAETVNGLVGMATQFFGPEWNWRPPSEIVLPDGRRVKVSEQERGQEVFGKAFAYKGWEGPNPMVSLFLFVTIFAVDRMRQPETKKKVFGLFQKIRDEIKRRREAGKAAIEVKKEEAKA